MSLHTDYLDVSFSTWYVPVLNSRGEDVLIGNVAYKSYLFSKPYPPAAVSCPDTT